MSKPTRVTPGDRASASDETRARIIGAAVALLAAGGRDAATTRAVASAAGVQPPVLYRLFGDIRGLLDAAACEALASYVQDKASQVASDDPLEDLRTGWDRHVEFGLAHPALYGLIYGDPAGGQVSSAAREGESHLRVLVSRVASAGRLRVPVAHAVRLIAAAGNGATLALISAPPGARDRRLSHAMREAVIAAVTTPMTNRDEDGADAAGSPLRNATGSQVGVRSIALLAALDERPQPPSCVLSKAEGVLLREWLDRLAEEEPRASLE